VAGPSKVLVYGSWFAEVAGSNSASGMNECLLQPLCVVTYRALRQADHSTRGFLPSVVCLSVIEDQVMGRGKGDVAPA
jgi:hypothetical protein